MWLSNHGDVISVSSVLGPVSLVHSDLELGFYGDGLSATHKKDVNLFVYSEKFVLGNRNTLGVIQAVTLPPFDSVQAGEFFPQASTESIEQLRTRFGHHFFSKMKARTGSHRVSTSFDADFAATADLLSAVEHTRTKVMVRVKNPTIEQLGRLVDVNYLFKTHEGADIIRCTVLPHTVLITFSLKSFRANLTFSFRREIRIRGKGPWEPLDNADLKDVEDGFVQLLIEGVSVAVEGVPVNNTTTLTQLRALSELYVDREVNDLVFFVDDHEVCH